MKNFEAQASVSEIISSSLQNKVRLGYFEYYFPMPWLQETGIQKVAVKLDDEFVIFTSLSGRGKCYAISLDNIKTCSLLALPYPEKVPRLSQHEIIKLKQEYKLNYLKAKEQIFDKQEKAKQKKLIRLKRRAEESLAKLIVLNADISNQVQESMALIEKLKQYYK